MGEAMEFAELFSASLKVLHLIVANADSLTKIGFCL